MSVLGGGGLIIGILFIGWLIFGEKGKSPESPPSTVEVPIAMEIASAPSAETEPAPALMIPEHTPAEKPSENQSPDSAAVELPDHSELANLDPEKICEKESNFFSRNNCMWRECEKPEFSELKECESRRPNEPGINQ